MHKSALSANWTLIIENHPFLKKRFGSVIFDLYFYTSKIILTFEVWYNKYSDRKHSLKYSSIQWKIQILLQAVWISNDWFQRKWVYPAALSFQWYLLLSMLKFFKSRFYLQNSFYSNKPPEHMEPSESPLKALRYWYSYKIHVILIFLDMHQISFISDMKRSYANASSFETRFLCDTNHNFQQQITCTEVQRKDVQYWESHKIHFLRGTSWSLFWKQKILRQL